MVALSIRNAEKTGVADKVEFVHGDLFESDLGQGTVITLYLSPGLNLKLRPKLLDLRPGTRVVSHTFSMAAWQPDDRIAFDGASAYLWIVPAKVAGNWKLMFPTEASETWILALDQEFQMLSGRIELPDDSFDVADGRVDGTEIRFHFNDASGNRYDVSGRVLGDRMEGTLLRGDGTSVSFSGERVEESRTRSDSEPVSGVVLAEIP
jgi:hypothetical protein